MSKLRANQLTDKASTGAPTAPNGLVVTGVSTATSFSGSGANLTALNAGNVSSGTLPITRGGTGLTSLGAAGKALKVNSSANGLEYGDAGAWTKIAGGNGPNPSATSISLDNIFSATYKFYKIYISWTQDDYIRFRWLRASDGGGDNSANYAWVQTYASENGDAGPSRYGGNGEDRGMLTYWNATDNGGMILDMTIVDPFSSSFYSTLIATTATNEGAKVSAQVTSNSFLSGVSHRGMVIFGHAGDAISTGNFSYLVLGGKL